jgi:hypothetical protein
MRNAMQTPSLFVPRLARETEPCASCGALLASDQRYCLSCGERRADARVPFPSPVAAAAPPPPPPPVRRRSLPPAGFTALYGLAGAVALGLGLLAGALIAGGDELAAAPTPVATIVPTATAAAPVATPTPAATAAVTFTPDWPAGQSGWTVQLQTLPKDGTTPEAVAAAKTAAAGQGAAGVGALDSDAFATLDGANYVIYSSVATTEQEAEATLDSLKANFPDAKVIEVSDQPSATPTPVKKSKDDLKQQERSQTPEDAQKNTRKAPPTVESEGTPPPSDDKAPGAGTDVTEIG